MDGAIIHNRERKTRKHPFLYKQKYHITDKKLAPAPTTTIFRMANAADLAKQNCIELLRNLPIKNVVRSQFNSSLELARRRCAIELSYATQSIYDKQSPVKTAEIA